MSFGAEHLNQMAETATETKTAPEINNSDTSFNPDKRLEVKDATDVGSNLSLNEELFNPDKRIDVNQDGRPDATQDALFHPDNRNKQIVSETRNNGENHIRDFSNQERNDATEKNVSELSTDYINDLKSKSEIPDSIKDDAIDVSKLEVVPSEKVAIMREKFDDVKADLRKEWEQLNNMEWPRYETDVLNAEGRIIRKAGDRYDMHHIQPLKLGGKNEVGNITPLDVRKHNEMHSANGSCNKLVEKVVGGAA